MSSAANTDPVPLARAPLHRVVFDARFPDSTAFGREAATLDLTTVSIEGDITNLWYDDLYQLWKAGPAAIAGMTTHDALFCLEMLGNDAGLRLVMRAEHRPSASGVEHTLSGPPALLQNEALERSGTQWGAHMAQLLHACPATRVGQGQVKAVSRAGTPGAADQPTLVSWVLAPLPRRTAFFI